MCTSGLCAFVLLPPRSLRPFTFHSHTPSSLVFSLHGSRSEGASAPRRLRKAPSEPHLGRLSDVGFFQVRPVGEEVSARFVVRQERGGAGAPRRGAGRLRPCRRYGRCSQRGEWPVRCGTAPWPKASTTRPSSSTRSMLVVVSSIGREKHRSMV